MESEHEYSDGSELGSELGEVSEMEEEPFSLSNSKYGTLEKFKASPRPQVDKRAPSEVSSGGLGTLKSDETGPVPEDNADVKGCQTKKTDGLSTEEYNKSREADEDQFTAANLHAVESLAPFNLRRVYGRLENVPAVNLTGIYKNHIVYATSNVIVIFDFVENSQHCLQGHRNKVTSLMIENRGRFLVSADAGVRSLIIVWETMTGKPVKFLTDVHTNHGSLFACFTGVDYIFASIGAEEMSKQTICFWNFDSKSGSKGPMFSGNFPKTTSIIRELSFLESNPDFFAATGDRNVLFGTWVKETEPNKGDSVHFHMPKLRKAFIAKHKRFTSSLWMRNGEWLATATGSGFVLIWGPLVVLALEDPPDPTKNIREFTRSFKLCETGITFFTIMKDYVVVGDEIGIVRFFDHEFKLLRWSKHFSLPGILSISFNLTDEVAEFKKDLRGSYDESNKEASLHRGNKCVRDYTLGGTKYRQMSQTTIPRPPMPCPDFVIGVAGGNVYYYHFIESQLDLLIPGTPGPFIACDVCPGSNHVLFATRKGEIQMYEFKSHKLIFSEKIFTANHRVSTLKFHPMGQFVAFGLMDGHVCFRRNYTWKTALEPLSVAEKPITRMIYTDDGLNLAYFDSDKTVVVSKYLPKGKGWLNLGKSKAHKKDIVDIQFFLDPELEQNRLFSLGLDRHLIEYDIERSSEETGLFIVKITNLEETCSPTAMVFDGPPEFGVDCITFSNDVNKIRLFSYEEEKIKKTCAGPVFGRDKGINRMVEFPIQMSEDRLKKFIVYIVRNKLGLMDTPVDGNPHKYMAVFTHPRDIIEVAVVPDRERIFTIGRDDNAAFSWEASPRAVEATVLMGGSGVAPFYHILRRHWSGACQDIIKDLDMIFFFLNAKRTEKQTEIYSMNRNIRICEIPAVCRACGFFPTEYEVSLMVDEARRIKETHQHYTDDFSTEFSFDEFVQLFVNHFYRTTDEDVEEAFKVLGFKEEDDEEAYICRTDFIKFLSEEGEAIKPHDFPVYFQPMYEIQEPGKFENVQCHTLEEEVYSESSSSSYSSASTVSEILNSGESNSSSSSGRENEMPESQEVVAQDGANDDEEEEEEDDMLQITTEDQDRLSDDSKIDEEMVVVTGDDKHTTFAAGSDKPATGQKVNTGGQNSKSVLHKPVQAGGESKQPGVAAGKKSIRMNEVTEEYVYEPNALDVGERENRENDEVDVEDDDDDLVDIPERVDLSYFLDIMLPQDCQQTIPWKAKTEPDKSGDYEREASAKRKKEEKEFLNSILKQIVDPNFPVPKKLLNTLLAEYYLEHGNFQIPADLQYPGTGMPTSWYAEGGEEEEEWEGENTSSTSVSSPTNTATSAEVRPEAPEAELGDDEAEEEGQGGADEEMSEVFDPEESGASKNEDLAEEVDHYEEEEEEPYSPPFTVSEVPMSAYGDPNAKAEDHHYSDGTEEMTDLDNVYEEEEMEFVRNVNQAFRPSLGATAAEGRKSVEKDRKSLLEKVRKSLVEKDRKSLVEEEKGRKSQVEKDRKSLVEKDRKSLVEKDRKSLVEEEKGRKSQVEKDRKSLVEKDRKSLVEKDRKSVVEVEKGKQSLVEKDRKSVVEKDRKSLVEKDKKSPVEVEKGKQSLVEKDRKSLVDKDRKSLVEKDRKSVNPR